MHLKTFDSYISWYIEQKIFALDIWSRSERQTYWKDRIARETRNLASLRGIRSHLRRGGDVWLLKPFERIWYEALAKCWQVEQRFNFDWQNTEARAERREVWAIFNEKAGRLMDMYGEAA